MSQGEMTLKVDPDLVKPVIEAQIEAAVIRELNRVEDLIPRMVNAIIHQKVDSSGKRSDYTHNNRYDYLEVVTSKVVRDAVKQAIDEVVAEKYPQIKDTVRQLLVENETATGIAQMLVDGLRESIERTHRFSVRVELEPKTPV